MLNNYFKVSFCVILKLKGEEVMVRNNGRNNQSLRSVKFTHNFTINALSSVLVEFGNTKVICTATVEEGKPKWMTKDDTRGWITAEYALLPSSTNTRVPRERNKVSGRTQEIQRLIGRSLRSCVDLEKLGERTVIVDADVIQADGGTRTASICGGYLALKDAVEKLIDSGDLEQNPIIEPIAAISIGIVDGDESPNLVRKYNIQAYPTFVLLKNGEKVREFQGFHEKSQLLRKAMI